MCLMTIDRAASDNKNMYLWIISQLLLSFGLHSESPSVRLIWQRFFMPDALTDAAWVQRSHEPRPPRLSCWYDLDKTWRNNEFRYERLSLPVTILVTASAVSYCYTWL